MYQSRINKLIKNMEAREISIVAICAGPMLEYFTGLSFHISERPVVLVIKAHACAAFIFPGFEKEKANDSQINLQLFPYDEDQDSMIHAFRNAIFSLKIDHTIGVEPQSFRFHEMEIMQKAMTGLNFISASKVF